MAAVAAAVAAIDGPRSPRSAAPLLSSAAAATAAGHNCPPLRRWGRRGRHAPSPRIDARRREVKTRPDVGSSGERSQA